MIEISKNQQVSEKKVAPIFLSNGISSTLIIPIEMARRYHLDKPSHVVLEEKEDGIFIKKLDLEGVSPKPNQRHTPKAETITDNPTNNNEGRFKP